MSGDNSVMLLFSAVLILAGFGFKTAAVPFHFWCPDAFEGAKIEVTTWLSVVSKAAGLILLARIAMIFCAAVEFQVQMSLVRPLAWVIGVLAIVTCTYGNFCAYK